jgi:hypothetical protein
MVWDIEMSKNFLDKTTRAQKTKAKLDKWNYIKLKKVWHSKGNT